MTDLKGFRSADMFNGDVDNIYLISLSKMLYMFMAVFQLTMSKRNFCSDKYKILL